jgi:hypothetical protein
MASPISWRDLAAPDAGAANSLIRQSSQTFNDSFAGINNLGALAREQSIRADQEQKQALANAQFGNIVNASNPNQIGNIDFAGLGANGGAVAALLQQRRKDFSDIQSTNAGTIGQTNINGAFGDNNTAGLNLTKSQTRGNIADAVGTEIGNLTLDARNNNDLKGQQIVNFSNYNKAIDDQLQQRASQPFYKQLQQDNATLSSNKSEDSSTFSERYGDRLNAGEKLTGAQTNSANANAYFNKQRGQVVKQDANTREYSARTGRISANTSRSNANTSRSNAKKAGGTGEFDFLNSANTGKAIKAVNTVTGQSPQQYAQNLYTTLTKSLGSNITKDQASQARTFVNSMSKVGTPKIKTPLNDPESFEALSSTERERTQKVFDSPSYSFGGVDIPKSKIPGDIQNRADKAISRYARTNSATRGFAGSLDPTNQSRSAILGSAIKDDPVLQKYFKGVINDTGSGGSGGSRKISAQQARLQGIRNKTPSVPSKPINPAVLDAVLGQLKSNQ